MGINYEVQICTKCGGEMEKSKQTPNPTCQKCQREYQRKKNIERYYKRKNSRIN